MTVLDWYTNTIINIQVETGIGCELITASALAHSQEFSTGGGLGSVAG
jgi:hypothetical protein